MAQTATPSPSVETVTVSATQLHMGEVIRKYVKDVAAPSPFLGKIARWKTGVCPLVIGLQPQAAALVANRIDEVSKTVGARLAAKESCRSNIEVVVTPNPQDLLNALRQKNPRVFGFSSGPSQTARLATMETPIQGWYAAATEDQAGVLHPDEMLDDCAMETGRRADCAMLASGFSLDDGLKSDFVSVLIIVDSAKVGTLSISSLADFVAMQALAQMQTPCRLSPSTSRGQSVCSWLPSSDSPGMLTPTDFPYLRALYRVQPDAQLNLQEYQISHDMKKTLSFPSTHQLWNLNRLLGRQ